LVWLPKETRNGSTCNENSKYGVLELSEKHLDSAKWMNGQLVEAVDLKTTLDFLLG
jgi:hypothetical protein